MLSDKTKKSLVDKIVQKLSPAFILLFGSYAKGTANSESDIGLAYYPSDVKLSSYEHFIFSAELSELAGYEVDLVSIRQIDTVFTMQIFEQGIPIYIRNNNEFIRQKMRAYSMYATLSEQRAPIIEAIKERGSVFRSE